MKKTPLRRKTPLKGGGRLRQKRKARGRPSTRTPAARRSEGHLAWIRQQPCCLKGRSDWGGQRHICQGDVIAAHIRIETRGGTGLKPNDGYTLPMCQAAHADEHAGPRSFGAKWCIDPKALAISYADRSPYRHELGDL